MNIEELRDFCLVKPAVIEGFPFNDSSLVFKVQGKIFLLTDLEKEFSISIKINPDKVIELREHYPSVLPGFHLNKKHWITVLIDGSINDTLIKSWIDESYRLIVKGLNRKEKMEFLAAGGDKKLL